MFSETCCNNVILRNYNNILMFTNKINAGFLFLTFFSIDGNCHYWYNYILCGLKGVIDELNPKLKHGFSMLVASTLPASCGLSSSSALVCGAALCLCRLLKIDIQSAKLAEICARSERFVSTQGGGMDQAACLLSREGTFYL